MNRFSGWIALGGLLVTLGAAAQSSPTFALVASDDSAQSPRPSAKAVGAISVADTATSTSSGSASDPANRGDGRQGTVKIVKGEVTLVSMQIYRAALPGGPVRQGDEIIVGQNSSAAVTMRDGTVVTLGPNSALTVSEYNYEPTSEDGNMALSLIKGTLRLVTGLITHTSAETLPAKVKVTTPTAVIGVRGTDVVVDTNS